MTATDEMSPAAGRLRSIWRWSAPLTTGQGKKWSIVRLLAAFFLVVLIIAIAFPELLVTHSPYTQTLGVRLKPPFWAPGALRGYPLGTDELGRDVLTRIVYGARDSILIALAAVALSAAVGIAVGVASGYTGGVLDAVFMRLADTQLSIPFILLAVGVIGAIGPSTFHLVIVLALTGWVVFARVARAESMRLKHGDYIFAARGMGASASRIVLRHIVPNAATALIVIAAFQVSAMVFNAAALSFLGLGVQAPTPSWGGMMSEGQNYIYVSWWLITIPGVVLSLTLMAVNILGEWLSDALGGVDA